LILNPKDSEWIVKNRRDYLELKRNIHDEYYFEIEVINDQLVLGIYKEQERNIFFDLGGFNYSKEIKSPNDIRDFVVEVIRMIEIT